MIFAWQLAHSYAFSLRFREEIFYPKKAAIYLKDHMPEGRIFSEYGWGGYLIWKLPEKKVFIDGRMPSWREDRNAAEGAQGAIDDYAAIVTGREDNQTHFDKYGIDTVLWSKSHSETFLEKFVESVYEPLMHKKNSFDIIQALENDGWKKIYEDEVSVIHQRPF